MARARTAVQGDDGCRDLDGSAAIAGASVESVSRGEIAGEDIPALRRAVTRWEARHACDFPWRRSVPVWKALVAEVMLQRTRAEQVVPVFERFDRRYQDPGSFAAASYEELRELLEPLGLRWRVPLMVRLAREIGEMEGRLPRSIAELRELPSVGEYVAAATLSLHSGVRAVILDANTVRLFSRLVGRPYDGETRRQGWIRDLAERITPTRAYRRFNYGLLDIAMTICTPSAPRCQECPLRKWCATGPVQPPRHE